MLGCHDFCGYYEWTFHHVRQQYGQHAVRQMWAQAIGGESQQAYTDAARADGLRGLLHVWTRTGQDEHCDWTFTLDESRNCLRWDMRQCPSKGFLIDHDLNADEDYCDHCMGWMVPLLERSGVEVAVHEHNHRGQCWGEMRVRGKPYRPLDLPIDIRKDERFGNGYVERFEAGQKSPLFPSRPETDPADLVENWFRGTPDPIILTGAAYAAGATVPAGARFAVVLTGATDETVAAASRFLSTPADDRPLLLHPYLPAGPETDFRAHHLPVPLPLLPILIRRGVYRHTPESPQPDAENWVHLLRSALAGTPYR